MSENKVPQVALFIADGCEEIEALTVADIMYRAGIPCTTVSVTDDTKVTSSHGITIVTDTTVDTLDWDTYDMIVLPGGIPGTPNLEACEVLMEHVREFAAGGRFVAAICAAPSILAHAGLLTGKNATCNPCVNEELVKAGANLEENVPVVRDGNIITSRAFGTAIPFGLELLAALEGSAAAESMAHKIIYTKA